MITAVTVSYLPYPEPIICDFLRSLKVTSKLINEVIVIYGDGRNFEKVEEFGQLTIRHISPPPKHINWHRFSMPYYKEHGFALKYGIEKASNEFILLTDPDVIFYMKNFDALYVELFKDYNLNFIGVSHYLKTPFHWDFPTVINCLTHKSKLPTDDWMKGNIKYRYGSQFSLHNAGWRVRQLGDNWPEVNGEYLAAGFISSRMHEYLNHNCFFNTGCNLFLWDKDNGSRSMTFRCLPHGMEYFLHGLYTTLPEFNKTAFLEKHKNQSLLRHSMGYDRTYKERHKILQGWLRESTANLITIL